MIKKGEDWYVINGELDGLEVVRVDVSTGYDPLVDDFERDFPGVTCINADIMRNSTAVSYGVMPNLYKRTIVREMPDG